MNDPLKRELWWRYSQLITVCLTFHASGIVWDDLNTIAFVSISML